ncbi:FxsA family protein [Rhodovibrio salinarum]|uniref:Uncharacterized protein n=1 Tax=Rhodovibrio salinarum TaxID=1087 RepID=A0A934QH33_9PROT|nr:FxsA family protein [Rhodovibrio salinarum]MBK1696876.1 hypothetical protein [Rhodovibrio salinarum]
MGLLLLILFIAVPIIEIAVLIQVGGVIGLWPTLGLVILTAIVGSMELRAQGLATVNKLRQQLDQGQIPTQTLFDGVCLLFAGALLLTPGFVTDITGMLLFLAPFRRFLLKVIGPYVRRHAEARVYTQHSGHPGAGGPFGRGSRADDGVIDADYQDVTREGRDDGADDDRDPNNRLRH